MTTTRAAEATKGPWKVDDGEALKVKGADGGTVASIFFASLTRRRPPEEAHANALLIAAAPALRDALEPFGDIDGEGSDDFPDDTKVTVKFGRTTNYTLTLGDFRRARAALKLAQGQV